MRLAILISLVLLTVPFFALHQYAFVFLCVADLICLTTIGFYVITRFGVLRAMSAHHALVCWQLIVGIVLFGVVVIANVALTIIRLAVLAYSGP